MEESLTKQEVLAFVAFALGDLVLPNNIEVEATHSGWRVIVLRNCGVPVEHIFKDWKRATATNPRYANIELYA